jgi:hypothetical protein
VSFSRGKAVNLRLLGQERRSASRFETEIPSMKSFRLVILSLCFVVIAAALTPNARAHAPRKILASAGLATMMGTVQDGNKLRFVTDQRAWNVDNPEMLEGHEGHYVRVTAQLYPSRDSIHIKEVSLPTAGETRKDDGK